MSRLVGLKPQTWPYLLGLEALGGPSGPEEDGGGGPSGLSKLLSRGFKKIVFQRTIVRLRVGGWIGPSTKMLVLDDYG